MPEKKKSQWHIAITHAFAVGVIFPLIASFIFKYLINTFEIPYLWMYILSIALNVVAIWLGVILSVQEINKKLKINEVKRFINLSTFYFVLIQIPSYFLYASKSIDSTHFLKISLIQMFILTVVFYISNIRYIKIEKDN